MTYWIYYYKKRSPNRILIQEGGLSSNPFTELNRIHSLKILRYRKNWCSRWLKFHFKKAQFTTEIPGTAADTSTVIETTLFTTAEPGFVQKYKSYNKFFSFFYMIVNIFHFRTWPGTVSSEESVALWQDTFGEDGSADKGATRRLSDLMTLTAWYDPG